jgi:hypothetical protein
VVISAYQRYSNSSAQQNKSKDVYYSFSKRLCKLPEDKARESIKKKVEKRAGMLHRRWLLFFPATNVVELHCLQVRFASSKPVTGRREEHWLQNLQREPFTKSASHAL